MNLIRTKASCQYKYMRKFVFLRAFFIVLREKMTYNGFMSQYIGSHSE